MKPYVIKSAVASVLLLASVAGSLRGHLLTASDHTDIWAGLQQVSSILFAIVGAWLAIVHPDILSSLATRDLKDPKKELNFARNLFLPLFYSTAIVALSTAALVITPWMKTLELPAVALITLKRVDFGVLIACSGFLLWSLFLSLVPMQKAWSDIEAEATKKRKTNSLGTHSQLASADATKKINERAN